MFLRTLLWILVIYLSYRFIFNFLIPVIKATRVLKRQMNEFREQMDNNAPNTATPTQEQPPKAGDYIDFEEIN